MFSNVFSHGQAEYKEKGMEVNVWGGGEAFGVHEGAAGRHTGEVGKQRGCARMTLS